ncbi:hypothetical protein J7481_03935 [Labrenzia sp. R4_2]|uniref:hypothetical protein n=1 Tax=Labrenzia sp. R4_2 TaxID=2821107 RepID=UPI001ADBDAA0|nr:hypothetical protein [Labrenzia sp. R4_2]MBO9418636.1 hypothetical protein [Labrenzia sp. R4_2]
MKKSQSRFVFGFLALLFFSTYAGYHIYDYWKGYAYYRYGDVCLKHKRGDVEFPKGNYFAARTNPRFWVSFSDAQPRHSEGDRELGLTVHYSKFQPSARQDLINFGGRTRRFCEAVPYRFGLTERVEAGDKRCLVPTSIRMFHSTAVHGPYSAVTVSCSTNPEVKKCRVQSYRPNGWASNISLSKTHVESWKAAVDAAENFFDNELIDCGDE